MCSLNVCSPLKQQKILNIHDNKWHEYKKCCGNCLALRDDNIDVRPEFCIIPTAPKCVSRSIKTDNGHGHFTISRGAIHHVYGRILASLNINRYKNWNNHPYKKVVAQISGVLSHFWLMWDTTSLVVDHEADIKTSPFCPASSVVLCNNSVS